MSETVLSLENVVKRFGGFAAVDDLSFDVSRGEIFGFLGPNGAGKTTTLRIILDIIQQTSGSVSVLGSPSAIPVRHRIGYLPEERGVYRKMKAVETIAYFAQLRGLSRKQAKIKAHELLERFGLAEFAKSKNEALSKGMVQKVQLLATIAHDPEFLILDEPFSGLDPINQHTLEELILELKAAGRTIIFSTHVMQHAERLCDRFLILAEGKKRFEGTLGEARQIFPPRLMLRTQDSIEQIGRAPGVVSVSLVGEPVGDESDYEIELTKGADPQLVLKAAFDAGVRLSRFENADVTLHDIFVALAGEDGEAHTPIDISEEEAAA